MNELFTRFFQLSDEVRLIFDGNHDAGLERSDFRKAVRSEVEALLARENLDAAKFESHIRAIQAENNDYTIYKEEARASIADQHYSDAFGDLELIQRAIAATL